LGERGAFALRLLLRVRLRLVAVLLELRRFDDLVFFLGADTLRDLERETDLLLREVDLLLLDRLTLMVAELIDGSLGVAARRLLRARRFVDRRRTAGEGDFGVAARRRLRDLDFRGALAFAERLLLEARDAVVLLDRLLLEAETDGDFGVAALRLLLFGALAFLELLRTLRLLAERLTELAAVADVEGARGVAARLLLLTRRFVERRRGEGEAAGALGTDALRRLRLLLLGALAFLELLRTLRLLADRLVLRELAEVDGARGVAARLRLRARRFLDRRRGDGEAAGALGTDAPRRLRRLGDLEAFLRLLLFFGFFTFRAFGDGEADIDIERFSFFSASFCASI